MDVTKIPFNEFIGLKISDNPNYLMMLDDKPNYRNHLDTVHATALFGLAEATSGHFLFCEFSELSGIIPVVRKVETKYRKPANGKIYSSAKFQETTKEEILNTLSNKDRSLLSIEVSLFDEEGIFVMQSVFEWFLTKQ